MSDGSVMLTNTLVHPCFVYTAAIHPKNSGIIATGGYDGYIRLWLHQKGFKTITTKPMFKLHGHETHVNALCFNKEGNRLYTGDGNGNVRIWASVDQDHNLSYECIKTVDTLKGVSIQSLQLHVSNRKLLVQTHGSSLHMLDTRIHRYLTHYTLPDSPWPSDSTVTDFHLQMAQVPGQFTKCSFSACGTFVFSSNSTGQVYVWMCDSGSFVNTYSIDTIPSWIHSLAIVDISFHPFDNSIAFSVWGDKQPFLIYRHSDNGPDLKRDGKHVNARRLYAQNYFWQC
jgi:WD40 repeat protein